MSGPVIARHKKGVDACCLSSFKRNPLPSPDFILLEIVHKTSPVEKKNTVVKRGRQAGIVILGPCRLSSRLSLSSESGVHALETGGELGVLLLDLELGTRSLGVREGVNRLAFGAGQLGGAFEVFEGLGDLALLEEELGHGGDGDVAFGVDCEFRVSIRLENLTNE